MKRKGHGTPALVRENNERRAQGLPEKKTPPKKRPSTAILPNEKKKRHQEILAGMLNKKGKAVIQKVLDKALDDEHPNQLEYIKLVVDRIVPKDVMSKTQGSNKIEININSIGGRSEDTNVVEGEVIKDE